MLLHTTYCMVVLLIAWWFYLLHGGFVGLVCLSMVQTGYSMPTCGISFILLVLRTPSIKYLFLHVSALWLLVVKCSDTNRPG